MKLRIQTPHDQKVFQVAWFEINTPAGNFVIQRGHAPMIVTLSAQQPFIICLNNGKQETFIIDQAILEVNREEALLLVAK